MIPFTHLHVHSQYSILDGAASIKSLVKKAKEDGMLAVALTDHGNMFGIKEFYDTCKKNEIKPILGVEAYVAPRSMKDRNGSEDRSGDHLVILAKNLKGYKNLLKLVSTSNIEGYYYKPRIDKELLEKHSEGLIISTACLGGEVSQRIMDGNLDAAREAIKWYKGVFGEDYYLELQRHPTNDPKLRQEIYMNQVKVNEQILKLSAELGVKYICTNDVHFTNKEDAEAHDILICLNTGRDLDDPTRMRYSKHEWFKSTEEMNLLFADLPDALANTMEIANKVESYELDSKPIMPDFPLPEGFTNEGDYLVHLTMEGAKKRYGDPIPPEKLERIEFELGVILKMGFPGYFLIVQDFINEARKMGVFVGPGRGSAAGSAVSYCVGITSVDPIKYDLLFERFLNPDRISMPDVDIDFDDDGRQSVIDFVTNKYGRDKVAHICTFGTMATKSSIKDVARVLKLPLSESNRLTKLVPDNPGMSFKKAYKEAPELLQEKSSTDPLIVKTLNLAEQLEGSVRQSGVHACGILISKDPLDEHIPVMPTKDEDILTTQYDGHFVEPIGLLKMDFLGLKTLSIIKETIENVKLSRDIEVDISTVPMEDEETFHLFSNGDTTAIFQFESPGMKKHLRGLVPNRFEDLVAMNALYRPGPMEYIPSFIERKHGREEIKYDHPMMETILKETYGVTVYQEQVMLLSRVLGNFTRGDSDVLRKAMGKKLIDQMNKLKTKFLEGCMANPEFVAGCVDKTPKGMETLINKIWSDWEAFASYAFNKSHSVCYAYVAYQTGYLKAHYPAEFMAGVLSRNLSNITNITLFMEETRRMGIEILGPDVNESFSKFTVNKRGAIRFGMAGIKGVGEGAVQAIIAERKKGGPFSDVYNFVERLNLNTVNKKNIEALVMAGAFDGLGNYNRSQFFTPSGKDNLTFIEQLIRYGNSYQQDKMRATTSLFGDSDSAISIKTPDIPNAQEWGNLEKLNKEKELIGIYLSAHPLDVYRLELRSFCNTTTEQLKDLEALKNRDITIAGMVTAVRTGRTQKGNPFGIITLEDYSGSFEFAFFGEDYPKFQNMMVNDYSIFIKARVQERRWGDGSPEIKVNSIEFITSLRKKVKRITLQLPVYVIDNSFITDLESFSKHRGEVALGFQIYDPETGDVVGMHYGKHNIEVTDDLWDFLTKTEDIAVVLN